MTDQRTLEAKLRIRAVYLWERDGRQEGRLADYFPKAQELLDREASTTTPIDESTGARDLLTGPLLCPSGRK
ncbi:DUF2934 domain-containing protein [Paraburkholderia strydomiana]|uniref:DUF2934 domain-containing protein n=1 Tax=Paraburkholderia strydomiana TaxID=1245417 RepID=UPI0028663D0D|nr:hypothetical protein [Paraburkholderia strydomiana]